jgi:hypothetical protein
LGFFRFEPYTEGRHLIRILGYIFFRVSSPWSIRPLTALQRSTSNDENKFQMEKGKWEDKQTAAGQDE